MAIFMEKSPEPKNVRRVSGFPQEPEVMTQEAVHSESSSNLELKSKCLLRGTSSEPEVTCNENCYEGVDDRHY